MKGDKGTGNMEIWINRWMIAFELLRVYPCQHESRTALYVSDNVG